MRLLTSWVLWVFLCTFLGSFGYARDGLSLQERWLQEQATPFSGFDPNVYIDLQKKHVLFVAGIMNGLAHVPGIASYFKANFSTVSDELGLSASYLGPPSSIGIPDNADFIYEQIRAIHLRERKPLILVGHSKGGAEILYTLLKYPQLIFEENQDGVPGPTVERAVLAQAAIGGSDLAAKQNRGIGLWILSQFLGEGLNCLDPKEAAWNFQEIFLQFKGFLESMYGGQDDAMIQAQRKFFSERIFYIKGACPRLSAGLHAVLLVCGKTLGGESDGLLSVPAQRLDPTYTDGEEFGVDLGTIPTDHMAGWVSGWVSRSSEIARKALMRAVLQQIYE